MKSIMMILGPCFFSIETGAYESLSRTVSYQWGSQSRLGHPVLKRLGIGGPAHQYIGPGDDSIGLNGTIYPQYKGGPMQLSMLRLAAGLGVAWPLVDPGGYNLGRWLIESVQEDRSELFADGTPRKITFSLSLKRYNEDLMALF